MIEFLSSWIEGVAVAVIITSIFEMILPNGNLKKYIKIILGIYIIFSIISPFVDSKALYSVYVPEGIEDYLKEQNTTNTQNVKSDLDKIYADTFEKEIKQTVEKRGYNVYKCIVEGIFDAEKKDAGINKIKIILESKNSYYEKKSKEDNTIDVEEVEKITIGIGKKEQEEDTTKITENDIKTLKNFLSEHYEIEQNVFDIQRR